MVWGGGGEWKKFLLSYVNESVSHKLFVVQLFTTHKLSDSAPYKSTDHSHSHPPLSHVFLCVICHSCKFKTFSSFLCLFRPLCFCMNEMQAEKLQLPALLMNKVLIFFFKRLIICGASLLQRLCVCS